MAAADDALIVALATPPGRGAISVVRLSGRGAIDLAASLAGRQDLPARVATLTRLELADGLAESAIVTTYRAPHSYTGEDAAEIGTHGSPVIVDAVLKACIDAGARVARPGEFTLRAYLNGRLDLLQAEAIADLVAATTVAQVRVASAHLEGTLSRAIVAMGDELAQLRALLEASLDFPDEGFHFIEPAALVGRLESIEDSCRRLLGSADAGQRLHDGALTVIAGAPNAGKSTMFNALLGRERAIVTAVAGTTRDLLNEHTSFGGVPVTLVDTAGIRDAGDAIEREGVSRAEQTIAAADLVLLVVDAVAGVTGWHDAWRVWESRAGRGVVCVINKADVAGVDAVPRPDWCPPDVLVVSAATGAGMAALANRLADELGRTQWDGATLTRARHRSLVGECAAALRRAAESAATGASEEYVLADVKDALTALEALRGVESPEEVLQSIFATFCIGK
jgi:tRNA modification GTPase